MVTSRLVVPPLLLLLFPRLFLLTSATSDVAEIDDRVATPIAPLLTVTSVSGPPPDDDVTVREFIRVSCFVKIHWWVTYFQDIFLPSNLNYLGLSFTLNFPCLINLLRILIPVFVFMDLAPGGIKPPAGVWIHQQAGSLPGRSWLPPASCRVFKLQLRLRLPLWPQPQHNLPSPLRRHLPGPPSLFGQPNTLQLPAVLIVCQFSRRKTNEGTVEIPIFLLGAGSKDVRSADDVPLLLPDISVDRRAHLPQLRPLHPSPIVRFLYFHIERRQFNGLMMSSMLLGPGPGTWWTARRRLTCCAWASAASPRRCAATGRRATAGRRRWRSASPSAASAPTVSTSATGRYHLAWSGSFWSLYMLLKLPFFSKGGHR